MSRKDFELIAASFKLSLQASSHNEDMRFAVATAALDMSYMLQGQYPRFDRHRFLKACACDYIAAPVTI